MTWAATLLNYLLMVHRCVVSVQYVTPWMCMDQHGLYQHELMCDALRMSQNLRKLHLVVITTNASQDLVAAAAVPESPARARVPERAILRHYCPGGPLGALRKQY